MRPIILILFCLTLTINAQENDSLKYFPSITGDMWEYFWYDWDPAYPNDTVQVFCKRDSIDADGTIYITKTARTITPIGPPKSLYDTLRYIIDTSLNVYVDNIYLRGEPFTDPILIYKLNAKVGDQWLMHDTTSLPPNNFYFSRVTSIENTTYFGMPTKIKSFLMFNAYESTDTTGIEHQSDNLAYGFGLILLGGGIHWSSLHLRGAVIDSVLYGDTNYVVTSVRSLEENIAEQYRLSQNYPNPFNPTTTIDFHLPKTSRVVLKVYDLLGKEVAQLLHAIKPAGSYSIKFNGSSVSRRISSGIYMYRFEATDIKNNVFVENRKMIILK